MLNSPNKLVLGGKKLPGAVAAPKPKEIIFSPEGKIQIVGEPKVKTPPTDEIYDPSTDNAPLVREITLRGVSPDAPVFNDYPFETLRLGQHVQLVPDPYGETVIRTKVSRKPVEGHPDPYAISVADDKGRHIGYIPKTQASIITQFKAEFPAMVMTATIIKIKGGGETNAGEKLHYGVDIVVRFYESESQVPA